MDIASVYRVLDCLDQLGLIHRVLSSGKVVKCRLDDEATCNLEQDNHCHHLMVCNKCGHIQEAHCPEAMQVIEQLPPRHGFAITGHHLEFTGLCQQCQAI